MPCRDDGYPTEEQAPAWMLCEAMTIIENNELMGEPSKDLLAWWKLHSEKEEARVRAEAARKLTSRERLALGINSDGQNVRMTRLVRGKKSA